MARILKENILKTLKERNSIHETTRCTYTVFQGNDGKKYIQLDTYGSTDRAHPEKISQSIQFDTETAHLLIEIIQKELQ